MKKKIVVTNKVQVYFQILQLLLMKKLAVVFLAPKIMKLINKTNNLCSETLKKKKIKVKNNNNKMGNKKITLKFLKLIVQILNKLQMKNYLMKKSSLCCLAQIPIKEIRNKNRQKKQKKIQLNNKIKIKVKIRNRILIIIPNNNKMEIKIKSKKE
ncbi:hypothetical protein PPERSA_02853 [Pseudocohnilembus persalinus]|uniref:Uncharacterized protein n=1 Tax=Pseudocohnilembus persalinus TaxID=266149 RepID=A0A0V0QMJ0_PSEPJ|nr:hypothetical protein PPERSA_02853 [Pseudocohnilembus persalinus]|eukprot:KRX03474.1 hypothetical protein PPERSA_02853 [Pseudocohnilembus persalinus]